MSFVEAKYLWQMRRYGDIGYMGITCVLSEAIELIPFVYGIQTGGMVTFEPRRQVFLQVSFGTYSSLIPRTSLSFLKNSCNRLTLRS
jgi:hypothetical protein